MRESSFWEKTFFLLKFSALSALLVFVSLLVGNLISREMPATEVAGDVSRAPVTVVIDAGHGGRDGGAVAADGTLEKTLNLAVAQKLQTLLSLADVRVVLTRETDVELSEASSRHKKLDDLTARIALAEAAENPIFVSIHMNRFPVEKYSGLQVYYSENNSESAALAETIQQAATSLDPANGRKIKPANGQIYLLKQLRMPAVLVECGFLSNEKECALLKTDEYQQKLAAVLFAAIMSELSADP